MFHYDWDWSVIWTYRWAFAEGLGVTTLLSLVAMLLGTISGLALGVVLSFKTPGPFVLLRSLLLFLIDAIKALPPLIVILFFYYWLPYLTGIKSSFWLAASALSLSLCVFVADVFRHAIAGVPRPQIDAGYALGMSHPTVLKRLIFPEALRSIVPTLGILYLDIFKLTSLASVIVVRELVHRASEVSTYTYRFLEVYAALAGIYLVVLLPFSFLVRKLESSSMFTRRS